MTSHFRPFLRKPLSRGYYVPAQPEHTDHSIDASSSSRPKLPDSIQNQIKSLKVSKFVETEKILNFFQTDILITLLEQSAISNSFNDVQTKFSKSMQEMAKYYFDQGGKLIRPTVSLLMSQACNQKAKLVRLVV